MLGRQDLDKLNLHKQALLLESSLNRLALQAEIKSLRSATLWVSDATRASREFAPLLTILAPLAGFLLARGSRRPDSWFNRLVGAVKWIVPLYRLWKSLSGPSTVRNEAPPAYPAA